MPGAGTVSRAESASIAPTAEAPTSGLRARWCLRGPAPPAVSRRPRPMAERPRAPCRFERSPGPDSTARHGMTSALLGSHAARGMARLPNKGGGSRPSPVSEARLLPPVYGRPAVRATGAGRVGRSSPSDGLSPRARPERSHRSGQPPPRRPRTPHGPPPRPTKRNPPPSFAANAVANKAETEAARTRGAATLAEKRASEHHPEV